MAAKLMFVIATVLVLTSYIFCDAKPAGPASVGELSKGSSDIHPVDTASVVGDKQELNREKRGHKHKGHGHVVVVHHSRPHYNHHGHHGHHGHHRG